MSGADVCPTNIDIKTLRIRIPSKYKEPDVVNPKLQEATEATLAFQSSVKNKESVADVMYKLGLAILTKRNLSEDEQKQLIALTQHNWS
jgi:hypothetical protein